MKCGGKVHKPKAMKKGGMVKSKKGGVSNSALKTMGRNMAKTKNQK